MDACRVETNVWGGEALVVYGDSLVLVPGGAEMPAGWSSNLGEGETPWPEGNEHVRSHEPYQRLLGKNSIQYEQAMVIP